MLRNTVQKDITERLFDFKSVWSKNCAVFRTAWLATDTNCKDEKSKNFKIFFLSDITYAADSESIGTNAPIGTAPFQTLLRSITNTFA